ncbi:MerR family transcriptional regulator [Marinimicrobium agarilyticum]|uniref:MerR family transcriptional regulator n=1 Tax=Marinimicrobium agarilyticum TaxID=306546 RepID=UPI0004009873|nr:MerR family transcriptional regulator [Marinimicrobium agarilyticum]
MTDNSIPQDAVPIRTVSEQTGVNSVTLRAWERRYGLIKPLRTEKGHRLYRPEDIERIGLIQQWLARGVAVGQVRALLEESSDGAAGPEAISGPWESHHQEIIKAVNALNRPKFERKLAELTSLYPPAVLVDQCLEPLLSEYRTAQHRRPPFGAATRLAFLESSLAGYFASARYRQTVGRRAPRLLLVDTGRAPDSVTPVILAYCLGVNSVRVDFFGPIPQSECVYAVEQLGSDALLLFSDGAPVADLAQQQRELSHQLQLPVWLAGRQIALSDPVLEPHCVGQTQGDILLEVAKRLGRETGSPDLTESGVTP